MSKEELLKYLIAEIDLIMHDKDYRFENQDGTWYSRESCRDLTNEEVFEELKAELMQLNSQVEQIADLEAKLAESEIKVVELRVKQLEKDVRKYKNADKELLNENINLKDKVRELKQQLAEKEKEIEGLKIKLETANTERHEEWKTGKEWKWEWQKVNRKLEQAEQNKISFAVEQLEKVKECIKKSLEYMWNSNAEMTCRDRNIIDGIYTELSVSYSSHAPR